jgi:hypothetical protein
MAALLCYLTLADDAYTVRITDGGQPVRYNHYCAACHEAVESLLYHSLQEQQCREMQYHWRSCVVHAIHGGERTKCNSPSQY